MPPRHEPGPGPDGDGLARAMDQARRHARHDLGFDELRPTQEEALRAVLAERHTLLVMPTGGGKSAVYQIAGALLPGCTVVVSPLLALQRDQLAHLADTTLDAAAAIDGSTSARQRRRILDAAATRQLEYLFLTPEQLANDDLVDALTDVSLVVVDEAHCIDAWGADFRPDYLHLGRAIRRLGRPVVLALTASASPAVRQAIVEHLGMEDPVVVVDGFVRPNIELRLEPRADRAQAEDALSELVEATAGTVLVYVARCADADRLARRLDRPDRPALSYHARRSRSDREAVHERFVAAEPCVVVATTAFGMGIDHPHVRAVCHLDAPESLDAYYQEIGRAGRDGDPARAALFWSLRHSSRRAFSAGRSDVDVALCARVVGQLASGPLSRTELARRAEVGRGRLERALHLLERHGSVIATGRRIELVDADLDENALAALCEREDRLVRARATAMTSFLGADRCRWQQVLAYFGEGADQCGHCDVCLEQPTGPGATSPTPTGSSKACGNGDGDGDGWTVGDVVTHRHFGRGTVTIVDDDGIDVTFDDAGPRRLDPDLLAEADVMARVS